MSCDVKCCFCQFSFNFQFKPLVFEGFQIMSVKGIAFMNNIFTEDSSRDTENMVIFLNNLFSIFLILNSK
jgi:hypothetical protein